MIAIQEASLAFEQALRRERWLRQDWYITSLHDYFTTASSTANVNKNDLDGCIMAIRKTMCDKETQANMYALPGQQGKVLVILRAAGGVSWRCVHPIMTFQ